jgi:hypothetical protein
VRFAIGLPNVGAYGDPGLLVELGSMAEQSDWDGVFIESHTDVDSSSEARRMADYEDAYLPPRRPRARYALALDGVLDTVGEVEVQGRRKISAPHQ